MTTSQKGFLSVSDATKNVSSRNSPRQSSYPEFDISKLYLKDDSLAETTEEMLSILHFTINKEFNVKADCSDEELFNLPNDLQTSSLTEQLSFIKDLVHKVCRSYLQLLVPAEAHCLDASPKRQAARRVSKTKSVVLSHEDCEVLCEMLKTPPKAPQHDDVKSLSELQVKYKELGQQLLESQIRRRENENEIEHLIDTNNRLRTGCKLMKQQIRSLERQLTESFEEAYKLEDSLQQTKAEVIKLNALNINDACAIETIFSNLRPR